MTRTHTMLPRGLPLLTAMVAAHVAAPLTAQANSPFSATNIQHLGTAIARPGQAYDLQPSIMFDRSEPEQNKLFKMWWLGRYDPAHADLPPANLDTGDRIYYATSPDGTRWSTPRVVLKGRGASAGMNRADDHLLGSPSVIKVHDVYYMFYEGYGMQVTTITNLWRATEQDTWNTHGIPHQTAAWDAGYVASAPIGLAPRYVKVGTHPVYSGEVVYPNGKVNRFLSAHPIVSRGPGVWRDLNEGKPVFWLYDNPAAGRKAIYVAFNLATSDSFATDQPGLGGHAPDAAHGWAPPSPLLGYAISSPTSADMARANQNAICLARSDDGLNWTRISGAAAGGAIRSAQSDLANLMPPHTCSTANTLETYDLHRAYGAGFPIAFVRDGMLELIYGDDSSIPINQCERLTLASRLAIPLTLIDTPGAYAAATVQPMGGAGVPCDVRWSAMLRRYVGLAFTVSGTCQQRIQQPTLHWSSLDVSRTQLPLFPVLNQMTLPTAGRLAGCGGLLGDELGQTVDFATEPAYSALHVFFESYPAGTCPTPFDADLDQVLVFAYPADMRQTGATLGMVAVPDTATGRQILHFRHTLGAPGAPVMLALRGINGSPTLLPLLSGVLDAGGRATLTVPVGPVGVADLQLESYSLSGHQQILSSGLRTLYLR